MLSLTACNDDYSELKVPQSMVDKSETIVPASSEDCWAVTKTNLDNIIAKMRGCAQTRAAYSRNYTVQSINGESGKPCIYVVNFENNGGYLLISASKRYNPILAYSETGNFSTEHHIGGLKEWEHMIISEIEKNEALPMDSVRQYLAVWSEYEPRVVPAVSLQPKSGSLSDEEFLKLQAIMQDSVMSWMNKRYEVFDIPNCSFLTQEQKEDLEIALTGGMYPLYMEYWDVFTRLVKKEKVRISNVDNFVSSTWDQEDGYNQFFPMLNNGKRAYAGCGPVAAGQIMYYFKHPNTYNWDAMEPNVATTESARLLYDIAKKAGADYDIDGTSTNIKKMKKVFEDLGYSLQFKEDDNFLYTVKANCDQHKPVYTRGTSDAGEGHAWVISGYHTEDIETYYEVWTFMRADTYAIYDKMFSERGIYTNFYMNWGWGGYLNGSYYAPFVEYGNKRAYLYDITPKR